MRKLIKLKRKKIEQENIPSYLISNMNRQFSRYINEIELERMLIQWNDKRN